MKKQGPSKESRTGTSALRRWEERYQQSPGTKPKTTTKELTGLYGGLLALLLALLLVPKNDNDRASPLRVVFLKGKYHHHWRLPPWNATNDNEPDWGGLDLQPMTDKSSWPRVIRYANDAAALQAERKQLLDKDTSDGQQTTSRQYTTERGRDCHLPLWTHQSFPTCNTMHEVSTTLGSFLGSGHFREAFVLANDAAVLKRLHLVWYLELDADNIDRVRREAFLLEQFSASRQFSNLYAYCGSSIVVEHLDDLDSVILPFDSDRQQPERGRPANLSDTAQSFNQLTPSRKLEIAIRMAESLTELHGFGVALVHDDVKAKQWMLRHDNNPQQQQDVVLNDLNSAFYLPWEEKTQTYCPRYRSDGGPRRSPEHYLGTYIDTSSDVFAFGHVLYSLLTGLYPYHEIPDQYAAIMEARVIDGILPHLHADFGQASWVEQQLIEIMDECYELDPEQRVDIFEVVRRLKETIRLDAKRRANTTIPSQ